MNFYTLPLFLLIFPLSKFLNINRVEDSIKYYIMTNNIEVKKIYINKVLIQLNFYKTKCKVINRVNKWFKWNFI